jgi:hypothetical protein
LDLAEVEVKAEVVVEVEEQKYLSGKKVLE